MAIVSIKRTVMLIKCDDQGQVMQLLGLIGTANISSIDPLEVRCRASIPNIRRVKRVIPNAKRGQDQDTQDAIKDLTEKEREWTAERKLMDAVRSGKRIDRSYKFKFKPYDHQIKGYDFMHASRRAAIFGDCGIGKTAIASAFIESLVEAGEGGPVLVVCPISIIRQAWLKDIEKFTGLKAVSVFEPSSYKTKEKRLAKLNSEADVYIISFSLLRIMEKELRAKKFKTIIIDESTKIKNSMSKTFRSLRQVAWKSERRYILSGTPAPNGPLDLWSQFFFLDDGLTLEPSLVDFRHEHFIQVGNDTATFWVPKSNVSQKIYGMVNPRSIRFKASECLDLPEQTFAIRECQMSAEQSRVYNEMAENLFVELEDGEAVTARIALSKLMKLREITGGFVIADNGISKEIKGNPKAQELDDLLEQIMLSEEHKAIIWIQYQWEARTIIDRYKKKYGAAGLYGGVSQSAKDENIDKFLTDPAKRILVCHPQSAAHGLTLTVASYSIYYSLSHNFEDYYQSSKRIHRPGQKLPTFYYFLACNGTIDQSLLSCIQDKKNIQDLLIDGSIDAKSLVGIRR